jgi:peptidoglycan/LPS O-acetylase OafA/YrhL
VTEASELRSGPRLDVQGLRALAVVAVVADHVSGWPRGGFVGVDVFFVVSGFLITGLLLSEHGGRGRISLTDFYRRRARRILPVASLVIVATVAATYVVLNASRGHAVAVDGVWALFFASNWHFAIIGTDYWLLDATSPLQHYWSLAVEEQFYLLWPWVLTALLLLARRRGRALLPAVIAVALLSFGYSLWHTHVQPTWAYFGTFDRAWELAVGAALALAVARGARLPRVLEPAAGWLGLAGIVLSLFVLRPDIAFPAPWAALPVLSTALVIAAGASREQRWLFPLVNPASRYVGDISYSVYLWHFPLVILLAAFFPLHGPAYVVWVLGLTATLSVASYHFVEDPVRRSSWLEPASRRQVRRDHRRPAHGSKPVVALALVLLSAATVVTSQVVGDSRRSSTAAALSPDDVAPGASRRDRAIAEALAATDFPDLDPGLDQLGVQKWKDRLVRATGCYDVYRDMVDSCVNGDPKAPHSAVVVGDSLAMSYMPGIVKALEPRGYRIQQLTKGQCPAWDVPVDLNGGGSFTGCDRYRRWAAGVVDRQRPELAVLVTAYGTVSRLSSGADGADATAEIRAGLARQIRRLQRSADRVVVLEPAPQVDHGLQECEGRFAEPADCVVRIGTDFELVERAERRAAADTGAIYVATRSWYCARNGACPAFVDHTPVRVDRTHLSIEYSTGLAPMLRRSLLPT